MNIEAPEIITKEIFLNMTIENIAYVYYGNNTNIYGKRKGEYVATSFMFQPSIGTKIDDKLVERRLKKAKKAINDGALFLIFNNLNIVDVSVGEDKTLTFYLDEQNRQTNNL